MQNNFVTLLNKYLTGKNWLAARPYTKDLSDKFRVRVETPLAELIDSAPELQKCDFRAVLRLCNKLSATNVVFKPKSGKILPKTA